jgi:surface protein
MFIAGFRNNDATILAVHAREDLIKAVQNQPITGNPTATDDNLRNINEWDVSHVTDMQSMFEGSQFNHPINNWNVRNVTNMDSMFMDSQFNHPLHSWRVNNVTHMGGMFDGSQFNHPLNNWDVRNVTNMVGMFNRSQYNHPLDSWRVNNVIHMGGMFMGSQYDHPLVGWNVRNVRNMIGMFSRSQYNHPLDSWRVNNVTNMGGMFMSSQYNHPLHSWRVNNVTNMGGMFEGSQFNHPINNWNVRNVTNMSEMFDSSQFNQPLHSWNVDNVRDMSYMFIDSQFNHPLDAWNITNVIEMPGMFFNSRITEIPASWHLSPRNRYYIFSDPDGSDEEFRNSTPEVTPEFVINTVETELSSRTYNLDISVYDPVMLEYKTIRQVFEDEDEIKDNIIILNHDLTTGSVIQLSDLSRNIREFVECKDDAPPDWQGNTYLDEWLKDGARMTTLITGPGGSNVHIEKPPWFYDGPVPFDRVFVLQERPPKMNKFVTTKLLPIPANPPADLALGADHCNQTSDSTIYTLVALTQERGRGGRVKKPKKKTKKKPKKRPKKGPKKSRKKLK